MTQQFQFVNRGLAVLVFVAATITSSTVSAGTVVYVADVESLYDAINNCPCEGAAVVLAPGTYLLSKKDPLGNDRPNGGRLELQKDMSLYGVAGDRAAVVIDATALTAGSFNVPFGRTGPVRIGRGSNTIEWLTVLGNPAAAAGIATELPGTPSAQIRVAHVVSGGSSRGIDVRNVGKDMAGRRIDAEIVDNEFFGPSQVLPGTLSEGIRVVNFVGADGGVILASLSGNRTQGFQRGCIVANNQSSNAVVEVRSSGDRFFANDLGCLIAGGVSSATPVANSNATIFEARGSQFVDNVAPIGGGGILVIGGFSTTQANVTSSNTVSVALWGSKVSDNVGVNFEAFGALQTQTPPPGLAGTNNHVTIALRGVSKQIDVVGVDSLPEDSRLPDPSGGNTVTVLRWPRTK